MNFDDTPQEAAFRSQAKAWISANAPKQYEEELKKSSLGRTQLKDANILDLAAGRGRVRQALGHVHHRPRHVRADHDGVRGRGA